MKGKFVFYFADGTKIIDRNGYKTMAQAKSWASAHNKGTKGFGGKIIEVKERTPPKLKRRKSSGIAGTRLRMPRFKF